MLMDWSILVLIYSCNGARDQSYHGQCTAHSTLLSNFLAQFL